MEYREKLRTNEVDLMDYWRVIVKRRWVLYIFAGSLIFFVGIFSFLTPPKYRSMATLLIEEGSNRILSIEDEFGFRQQTYNTLYMDTIMNTQINILKSRALARQVAEKMNLLSRPEFRSKDDNKSILASIKNFIFLKWLTKKDEKKPNNSRLRDPYTEVIKKLRKEIDVAIVQNSKLVNLSYTCGSPIMAADIVNTFADEFIIFSIEKRYTTTQRASDFLSEQIADLRNDLAAKERELQQYGQEAEIFYLDENESSAVEKFADLNKAFTQAQINRINAEAKYRELRNLKIDSLPQFVDNKLIQDLKTDYTRIKNEYEENSKVYKPSYPEMVRLKARVDSMRTELENEIQKAVDAAETEYRSAYQNENSLGRLLDAQKETVGVMKSNAILYNSLRIEVENKRKLLNSLVERQNETLVSSRLGGLKSTNLSIIDEGMVPEDPVSPRKKLNLMLAMFIGLFGGVGLCFVFEYFDNTVKNPEDIEEITGVPSLGIVPHFSPETGNKSKSRYLTRYRYGEEEEKNEENVLVDAKNIELINHLYPKLSIAEDYRTIRTSILLSRAGNPPKTILVSSSLPREGKSVTTTNLAISFAQLKKKVVVIDTDLRRPRLHKIFDVSNIAGVSTYLSRASSLKDDLIAMVLESGIENIWVLPAGPVPPNPAELLNSQNMDDLLEDLKENFDVILLDTPPILSVIDGVILASKVDSVLLVIHVGKTTRKDFINTVESLKRANGRLMGTVFNWMEINSHSFGYMHYYPYYGSRDSE